MMLTDPMEPRTNIAMRNFSILAAILFLAAALRLVFFNGFFGSDDLVYLQRSLEISNGVWTSANYNGALRYGYNLPAALFIYIFGLNAFTANMWTLLCSLGEIAIVFLFTARFIGLKAAIYAGLVLACIPLHIALGTRIHADSVLAFFLTLAFVLFYWAERSHSRHLYFATGLALGMIFWSKELGVITFLAFLTYPFVFRRLNKDWFWVVLGGAVMLVSHLLLMQLIAGDPLHLIKTVTGQVQTGFVQGGGGEDAAGYYFRYLFVDIKHTWLASFLAFAAMYGVLFRSRDMVNRQPHMYVAWWLIALLVVLSFTPVSFSPFRLAMKQSNYLNLFLAPIAIFAGVFLANFRFRILARALTATTLVGGILLGAMAQQSYRLFTANSRAAVEFMQANPDDWVVGSFNNVNIARVTAILDVEPDLDDRFGYLSLDKDENRAKAPLVGRTPFGFAVLDQETQSWGKEQIKLGSAPSCWKLVKELEPDMDGLGHSILTVAVSVAERIPSAIGRKIESKMLDYSRPLPAKVYRIDLNNIWCGSDNPPKSEN